MTRRIVGAALLGCASLLLGGAGLAQTGAAPVPTSDPIPVALPGAAQRRPYTVEDMLAAETFGKASIDPSGRRVVFERLGPRLQATRFDLGYYTRYTAGTLWLAEVAGGPARRLLPSQQGVGLMIGAWSPSGDRFLVHRIRNRTWDAGVVDVATGAVRWLDLAPESQAFGRTLQWRSDDEIVAIHRPRGGLPAQAGATADALDTARARQDAGALGRFSGTRLGAGAFAEAPLAEDNLIVSIDVRTGARRTLASGRFFDLELSPDGRWLAAMESGAAPPLDLDRPVLSLERPNTRRVHLLDVASGARVAVCEACNPAAGLMSWSGDSRRLLIWDRTAPGPGEGRLVALSPDSAGVETFDLDGLSPGVDPAAGINDAVRAAWLGDRPILRGRRSASDRDDWWILAETGPRNLTQALPAAPGRLEAVSTREGRVLADGRVWTLSADDDARPASPHGLGLSGFSGLDGFDPPRLRLNAPAAGEDFAVACPGGRVSRAVRPDCPAALSSDRRIPVAASPGAVVEQGPDGQATRLVLRGEGGERTLATINTALEAIAFAPPIAVPHAAPDGATITSWLYLPPVRGETRLPLVVIVYPGAVRGPQTDPAALRAEVNIQLFAAAGYAVLVASVPRQPETFEPAAGLGDQIVAVLDAALALHPELDGDRVALTGHSFGGYAALVAATQTDRFRSIIAAASISNLSEKWGEGSPTNQADPANGPARRHWVGQVESGSQTGLGGPPWRVPDRYHRNSPLFAADRITAPVLLIHGDQDTIPSGQAQSMFTALWRQNKDARLLTYWGEGHSLESPENIRDVVRQQMDWLAQTLGPPARAGTTADRGVRSGR